MPPSLRLRVVHKRLAWSLALAASLLLKAAVPLLAASAASAQGLPVAEICSVYGVRTVAVAQAGQDALDASAHAPQHLGASLAVAPAEPGTGPHDDSGALPHHGDHCALGALGAFAPAPPAAEPAVTPAYAGAPQPRAQVHAEPARDAVARWTALRKQGPPGAGA